MKPTVCGVCGQEIRLYWWAIGGRQVCGWRHPAPGPTTCPHVAVLGTPSPQAKHRSPASDVVEQPPAPFKRAVWPFGEQLPIGPASVSKAAEAAGWAVRYGYWRNEVRQHLFLGMRDAAEHPPVMATWTLDDPAPAQKGWSAGAVTRSGLPPLTVTELKALLANDDVRCTKCGLTLIWHTDRCPRIKQQEVPA